MKSIQFICLVSLCFSARLALSQDTHITIAVSRDTVLLGNAFYVQYSFDARDGQMITPEIKGAKIIGQNFVSSTSVINGEIKSVHKQKYLIEPKEEGIFTIPGSSFKSTKNESSTDIPDVTIVVKANPGHLEIEPEDDSSWQFNEIKPGIGGPKRKSRKL